MHPVQVSPTRSLHCAAGGRGKMALPSQRPPSPTQLAAGSRHPLQLDAQDGIVYFSRVPKGVPLITRACLALYHSQECSCTNEGAPDILARFNSPEQTAAGIQAVFLAWCSQQDKLLFAQEHERSTNGTMGKRALNTHTQTHTPHTRPGSGTSAPGLELFNVLVRQSQIHRHQAVTIRCEAPTACHCQAPSTVGIERRR